MKAQPQQDSNSDDLGHILRILGSEKRMEIINFLQHGEKTRREIQREIKVSLEAVVKHCKDLEEIGVIKEVPKRGERGFVCAYFLIPDRLKQIGEALEKAKEREFVLPNETLMKVDPMIFQKQVNKARILIDSGMDDGKEYALKEETTIIGRNPKCNIPITFDRFVSWNQARITKIDKQYFLEDLGSTNRTIINGKELFKGKIELKNGDQFKVGKTWVRFLNE
jgi:DNA-binding transcriptional ArsR family regulator